LVVAPPPAALLELEPQAPSANEATTPQTIASRSGRVVKGLIGSVLQGILGDVTIRVAERRGDQCPLQAGHDALHEEGQDNNEERTGHDLGVITNGQSIHDVTAE